MAEVVSASVGTGLAFSATAPLTRLSNLCQTHGISVAKSWRVAKKQVAIFFLFLFFFF